MFFLLIITFCSNDTAPPSSKKEVQETNGKKKTLPGSYQISNYIDELKGKKCAIVANQSSVINNTHLIDTLLSKNINIKKVFAPEHGFRGTVDAGEKIKDKKDNKTGLRIHSLYGKNKKPTKEELQGIEIIVYDIQDVGVRCYTYLSTLHYIMKAAIKNEIKLILMDRPNPNINYIDGPVLDTNFRSFVGMHPVPLVYGMTIGEYAKMINEEKWHGAEKKCDLKVIPCNNYTRNTNYTTPVNPSPNLPNLRSILLYPSLVLFEGTSVNVGRGTEHQFQFIGHPKYPKKDFSYTPISQSGAKNPKHLGDTCYGINLTYLNTNKLFNRKKINLKWLKKFYHALGEKNKFFKENFFDKLAGNNRLRNAIKKGFKNNQLLNIKVVPHHFSFIFSNFSPSIV
ncbi:MAG: exo-beta-N-acetylmuramidase NamZ domain-containing protein [Flavobacteriales bacterium]